MAKPSQAQVREINRTLLATVRADWRFPDTRQARRMTLDPLSYRERYYSTSDAELDGSPTESEDDDSSDSDTIEASWSSPETEKDVNPLDESKAVGAAAAGQQKRKRKFQTPDDVAAYIECKTQKRRKRRTRILAEELQWNEGLCFFLRRRNAWTGALTQEQVQAHKAAQSQEAKKSDVRDKDSDGAMVEKEDSSSSSSHDGDTDSSNAVSPDLRTADANKALPSPSKSSPFAPPADPLSLINVVTPISIPFLPATHPVRASIMSRSQAELYDKIVRDSRTPAVPLNLAHMMVVIVQGWKDEGNWPPKSALAEAGLLAGGRRRSAAGAAASSSGQQRRRQQQQQQRSGGVGSTSMSAASGQFVQHGRTPSDSKIAGLFEGHKHLQRGVESVRRAFRLSGSGPPAGD